MENIIFPSLYNNDAAHRQVKQLMRQRKNLYIKMDGEAIISTQGVTGLRYQLSTNGWQWILNYLQTGEYEDFGIFPSNVARIYSSESVDNTIKGLIEQKFNIARIPFLRETEAYIKLRGLFRFGKIYFSIRRSDEFIDYLNSKGL